MLNRIHHGWMRPVHQGARAGRHRSQSLGMTVQLDLGGEEVVARSARGHRQDVAPPERRGRLNCGQSLGLYRRCRWGQGSWPTFSVARLTRRWGLWYTRIEPVSSLAARRREGTSPYPRVLGADSEGGRDDTRTDCGVWAGLRRAGDEARAPLPDRGTVPLASTQPPPAREHGAAPRRPRRAGAHVGFRR